MAQPIGTLGNIPTITAGGRIFTDLTTIISLVSQAGTTNGGTFRKPGITSGYAVTSGKTLTVGAMVFYATANVGMKIAQTDNDIGLDASTAFTNPVYLGSSSGLTFPIFATLPLGFAPNFPVAATKYLSFANNSSGTTWALAYGYEA